MAHVMAAWPGWQTCIRIYIDGKREIRDINISFRVQYESGDEAPERTGCGYNSF